MSKHTPTLAIGAEHEGPSVRSLQIIDPVSLAVVAHVYGATTPLNDQYEGLSRMRSNAQLFAAAPKLLAALEGMVGACALGGAYLASCRRDAELAIAQAKGEHAKKCCKPTADEEVLLATGEYTPEELWGGRRPTCPKCIGDEQP